MNNGKQYAIVGSNKYQDLTKMKILESFECNNIKDYEIKVIPAWSKWSKKYKFCYIAEIIFG